MVGLASQPASARQPQSFLNSFRLALSFIQSFSFHYTLLGALPHRPLTGHQVLIGMALRANPRDQGALHRQHLGLLEIGGSLHLNGDSLFRSWVYKWPMVWLIAGGIVLWLAFASVGFRRLLVILTGVVVAGAALVFAWLQYDQRARTKDEAAAKLRIPHANVELVDLRMGTDSSSVTLTGRVRNNDPRFTLTEVELRLRVQECTPVSDSVNEKILRNAPTGLSEDAFNRFRDAELAKAGTTCETVGDTTESIFVNVPPQQARELDRSVYFSGIGNPRMKRTWAYEVVSISGEPPTR